QVVPRGAEGRGEGDRPRQGPPPDLSLGGQGEGRGRPLRLQALSRGEREPREGAARQGLGLRRLAPRGAQPPAEEPEKRLVVLRGGPRTRSLQRSRVPPSSGGS